MVDIRNFQKKDLESVKSILKESFYHKGKDEVFNEWEFAERILSDAAYREELCFVAEEDGEIIGYCILTDARIDNEDEGLALGPVAVKSDHRGIGVGSKLIETSLMKAREEGFPWVAVLGSDYYNRFGFEMARTWNVVLGEEETSNEYLKILFFDAGAQGEVQGIIRYCDVFYNKKGELL